MTEPDQETEPTNHMTKSDQEAEPANHTTKHDQEVELANHMTEPDQEVELANHMTEHYTAVICHSITRSRLVAPCLHLIPDWSVYSYKCR